MAEKWAFACYNNCPLYPTENVSWHGVHKSESKCSCGYQAILRNEVPYFKLKPRFFV